MISFNELRSTPEYWITRIQLELYAMMDQYMQTHQLSRTELAHELGVSKSYVSQVLNGDFDHRISKLVELSMAIGLVPQINYIPMDKLFDSESTVGLSIENIHVANKPAPGTTMFFEKNSKLCFSKVDDNADVLRGNTDLLKAA